MGNDMISKKRAVLLGVAGVLIFACSAWGKVIYVDDDAPLGGDGMSWATAHRSLQDALFEARWAGVPVEIRVAQGTYKPDQWWAYPGEAGDNRWEHFFRLDDNMSLLGGYAGVGAGDPDARDIERYETILSGDLLGNDAPVTDVAALRDDPTREDNSLVVRIYGNAVRLDGCVVAAGAKAALEIHIGSADAVGGVTISNCQFLGNCANRTAIGSSGAVLFMAKNRTDVILKQCTFIGNAGHYGGAVSGADLVLDGCRFVGNYAWGFGGAFSGVRSTLTDCTFVENRAGSGGALNLAGTSNDPDNKVIGCVFRRNSALQGSGGAIVCQGKANIARCLFVGNEAPAGGACHSQFNAVTLIRSILVGNQATEGGGGAYLTREGSELEIVNCTIVDNRAPTGASLFVDLNSEPGSSHVVILNSILSNGSDEIWSNDSPVEIAYSNTSQDMTAPGDGSAWLDFGPGNVTADPLFADPGYWDTNGTLDDPNDDFFAEGDYHLKSQAGRWDETTGTWVQDEVTSPCIDAGDPNSPIMYEPFPNGGVINMGAYGGTEEASKSYFGESPCETIIAGDINGDCRVDLVDIAILLDHWLQTGLKATE